MILWILLLLLLCHKNEFDDVGKHDVIFLKNFFPGDGFVMVGVI